MKVTPERIKALMARVTVTTVFHDEPTKHAISIAWLDGSFKLAENVNKAVDPANFDEQLAIQYSTEAVLREAEDKLWMMEGYKLYDYHMSPTTHVERMQTEYDENKLRLTKLEQFLDKGKPDWMNTDTYEDMVIQHGYQKLYVDQLYVRLLKAVGSE